MTEAQWRRVWAIFDSARASQNGESRTEGLSDDPEVVSLVREMLEEAEATASPQPGARYGRYELIASLGHGGMGEVYSARDADLNRMAALKFLNSRATGLADAEERLVREAQAASALNHPNIVTVYEVIRTETAFAIATELVQGPTLRELCGRPQSIADVARWGEQIARGLAAAHANGIVHGDIKPENLMLRADGYLKIVDFGLAHQIGEDHPVESLPLGTLGYMSPEQVRGGRLTSASDVFLLGVVLIELLSGAHPFLAGGISQTTRAIASLDPIPEIPVVARAPDPLRALLRRMIEKDPALRATAAEVAEGLASYCARPVQSARSWKWLAAPLVAASIGCLILWSARSPAPALTPVVTRISSYEGREASPTFSPDGHKVAFSWDSDGPYRNIYYKVIGEETPVRLTNRRTDDFSPVWSPDGSAIAFLRHVAGEVSPFVMLIPASGGAERQVGRIIDTDGFPGPVAWFPDSRALILRDDAAGRIGLVRLDLNDGEKRVLTSPGMDDRDGMAVVSPDQKEIAFVRYRSDRSDAEISVLPVAGGPESCPFRKSGNFSGLSWQPDGRALIYSADGALWRLPVGNEGTGDRNAALVKLADGEFANLALDRANRRLAADRGYADTNIWRVTRGSQPVKLIASSSPDSEPQFSPDGRKIVFRSMRTGSYESRVTEPDGSHPTQITHYGAHLGSPRWSPDGSMIAFTGDPRAAEGTRHNNIYLVPAAGGQLRRLTDDSAICESPAWLSHDGRGIYYSVQSGAREETWRMSAEGGRAVRVSGDGLFDLQESADGQWLYYTISRGPRGIWRRPVTGGNAQLVAGSGGVHRLRYWDLARDGLYFAGGSSPLEVLFFSPAKQASTRIGTLPDGLEQGPRGLAVSPDGNTILFVREDTRVGDLYLIEKIFP